MDNSVAVAAAELKAEIREAANKAIRKFYDRTGFSPSNISVRMLETTHMGSNTRLWCIGSVDIRVDL